VYYVFNTFFLFYQAWDLVEKIHRLIEIGFEKMKQAHACSRFDGLDSKKNKKEKINGLCVAVGAFYNFFPERL
jgi:hypothetical protein